MTHFTSLLPTRTAHEFQPLRPQLLEKDFEDLIAYIWLRDHFSYEHPRDRIQVLLAILLCFHLGLHPTVALSEGFYYKDTTLLVRNDNGNTRVLLVICLKGRQKNQRSAVRWLERSMILADDPTKRRRCPVTMFLAMALADGAVDMTQLSCTSSTWTPLEYTLTGQNLPVWRTARRSVLYARELRPRSLQAMMQAQICRAGHKATFSTILEDTRKAAKRERQILDLNSSTTPHILLGRGQGNMIFNLLAPHLDATSHMPCTTRAFRNHCDLVVPSEVDDIVESQLRYDVTRANITMYLYRWGGPAQLLDVLWSLREAASPRILEAYYPFTKPDNPGDCPHCGVHLTRSAIKMHLLRCYQRKKVLSAGEQCTNALYGVYDVWLCRWGSCNCVLHKGTDNARSIAAHLSSHLLTTTSPNFLHCEWDSCHHVVDGIVNLHIHMEETHKLYTSITLPVRAEFCFECGFWGTSELDWDIHVQYHTSNPNIVYGPIFIHGLLAAAGRCPYCMRDGVYLQMEKESAYIDHVKTHIVEEMLSIGILNCPHPTCGNLQCGKKELYKHMQTVHSIPLLSR